MLDDRVLETTLECGAVVRYRPISDELVDAHAALRYIKNEQERHSATLAWMGHVVERCVIAWSFCYSTPDDPTLRQPLPINRGIVPQVPALVSDVLQAIAAEAGEPIESERA